MASAPSGSPPTGAWPSSSAPRPPAWCPCRPGLDVADAPIVEPASVSWHALRLADTGPASRVAVVGAGALGLLAVAGARHMGVDEVALEARHRHQQEVGERLGAHIGADQAGYDVVVEAAGSTESLARAIDLVAPHGTVVVLGVHLGNVELNWMPLFHREASIVPSLGYCRHESGREMEDAAAMLAQDPDIAQAIITHRFGIDEAPEAFRVAGDGLGRHPGGDRAVLSEAPARPGLRNRRSPPARR